MPGGQEPYGDVTSVVWLYSDGCCRWVYERDLRRKRFETRYVLRLVILVFALGGALLAPLGFMDGSAFAIITGIGLGGGLFWLITDLSGD